MDNMTITIRPEMEDGRPSFVGRWVAVPGYLIQGRDPLNVLRGMKDMGPHIAAFVARFGWESPAVLTATDEQIVVKVECG